MTKTSRTPDEIRQAIYDACGGDWIDENGRIGQLQEDMIAALTWIECPPQDGWYEAAARQIEALRAIDYAAPEMPANIFDIVPDASPEEISSNIAQCLSAQKPWDVAYVAEYIAEHSK